MDADAKKTALRMIPYGIYVLTAKAADGTIAAAPILDGAHASVECRVAEIVERGGHRVVLGEVIGARVASAPAGRPDEAILEIKDLGEKVFYGG